MSIVDIDLSKFDYANPKILEELYLETPINVPDDNEFFNLPLNEEYKNNKERIERDLKASAARLESDAKFLKEKTDANFKDAKFFKEKTDAKYKEEKEANESRKRCDTKVENETIISNKPSDK